MRLKEQKTTIFVVFVENHNSFVKFIFNAIPLDDITLHSL